MTTQTIRIAMLNADTPVPEVYANRAPTYGQIFHNLFTSAASRLELKSSTSSPAPEIKSTDYNVQNLEYPPDPSLIDAILITGSANAAYENIPWLERLNAYIRHIYTRHPRIKIFGSCFGHQIVCQSLLKEYGVYVEKDPNGHEMGVQTITTTPEFRNAMNASAGPAIAIPVSIPEKLRLQFIHGDHVKLPSLDALPPSWVNLGRTQHCAVQGVYEPGRVLTYQGHFEFDRFVNSETLKFFAERGDMPLLEEYLEAADADDDAEVACDIVLRFFMEWGLERDVGAYERVGGLLTPPVQE
ncbi:class I glutamine amidotransferase-like protein [Lophiostoma macrostomum CBS 122681]|uniref:Class I glutamine amidotransferase-like protein n=1 Tax=Lophiostoma macrostomum CBS 122681 TaxID=1314788 RepID=A0A6A6SK64_9PLEO|nr:class I glutamine amidotransferase-like protein [Lophiostoma macrostomum CBS 122681]